MRFFTGLQKYGWRGVFIALHLACQLLRQRQYAWRRLNLRLFCRARVGKDTQIADDCLFSAGAWMNIGERVYIGRDSTFVIGVAPGPNEQLFAIGDNTWISERFLLLSLQGVRIGKDVLIGEAVSIRDSTHRHEETGVPIREQGDVLGKVTIEDDVWIGRGCLIQGKPEGVTVGRGAIIAANSVVSRSVPPMEVWGGVPARFIKNR